MERVIIVVQRSQGEGDNMGILGSGGAAMAVNNEGQNPNFNKGYKCTTQTYILKFVRCSELLKSIHSV